MAQRIPDPASPVRSRCEDSGGAGPRREDLRGICAMALKGIIFDLDGVLVDTVPAHIESWRLAFAEFGVGFDASAYRQKVDGLRRLDAARAIMPQASPQQLAKVADIKGRRYLELIEEGRLSVFEDSVRFVRHCAEGGLLLATASSSENARNILCHAELLDAFQVVVGGDDVQRGKPDPEPFLTAARGLGLPASDCVVFEDAAAGVQAAKAGGFYCVGIRRSEISGDLALADEAVPSLGDIDLAGLTTRFEGVIDTPA